MGVASVRRRIGVSNSTRAILALETGREIPKVEFRDGDNRRVGSLKDSFYRLAIFRCDRQIRGDEVDIPGHEAGPGKVMRNQRLHQLIGTGADQNHAPTEKIGVRDGVEYLSKPSIRAAQASQLQGPDRRPSLPCRDGPSAHGIRFS